MRSSMIEACFFDLDKTLIDDSGKPYDGIKAALSQIRQVTSVIIITSRNYPRYTEVAERNPYLSATRGMPVGLEGGGRIVDGDSGDNLFINSFTNTEFDAIYRYIHSENEIYLVAFQPQTPHSKTHVWCKNYDHTQILRKAYERNATVVHGTSSEIICDIEAHTPCMITCKFPGGVSVNSPEELRYSKNGNTINITPATIDKGVAALIIAGMIGTKLKYILAAGNDSTDLPMLTLEGLGHPILVGNDLSEEELKLVAPKVMHVPNQTKFGKIILSRLYK